MNLNCFSPIYFSSPMTTLPSLSTKLFKKFFFFTGNSPYLSLPVSSSLNLYFLLEAIVSPRLILGMEPASYFSSLSSQELYITEH